MSKDPFGIIDTTQAGAYVVEDMVGEGGFAVVYRAHHTSFRAKVALKCLKVPEALTAEQKLLFLERFREEGELLFRLSAGVPSVVRPLHVGTLDTPSGRFVPFIALEWLEGQGLDEYLRHRAEQGLPPLSLKQLLRLLAPIAAALGRAHRFPDSNGEIAILHRDLKPENIFVCTIHGQLTCKILDFGIGKVKSAATQMAGQQSMTDTGVQAFTPGYAAPEQWLPKRFGQTGPWTDVWGFAITLVEVLSGRSRTQGDAAAIFATAINPEQRPTPRGEGVEVSDAVEAVFTRALSVEPAERQRDVGEFWRELSSAAGLDAAGVSIPPPAHDPRLEGNLALSSPPDPMGQTRPAGSIDRGAATVSGGVDRSAPTVSNVPELELSRPISRPRASRPAISRGSAADPHPGVGRGSGVNIDYELDGVGLSPMSAPARIRPARAAPLQPASDTGYEVRRRLAGPLKLVFLGVAIMAADFAHAHYTDELFAVGPVRPIYIAGPMVLIGLLFAFGRLVR